MKNFPLVASSFNITKRRWLTPGVTDEVAQ